MEPRLAALKGRYLTRLVHSNDGLREKINIFDLDRDDRIIELVKQELMAIVMEDFPGANVDKLFFHREPDEKQDSFEVIADGAPLTSYSGSKTIYDVLYDEYIDTLPDIDQDGPELHFKLIKPKK